MSRGHVAAALGALGLLIAGMRLTTYHEPLERDITTYAVIGHEMLGGRALYTDLWDHKPPAIHGSFALAERAVGYGPGEVYALGVLTTCLTALAVFATARVLAGDGAGIVAAALFAIVSGDLGLQANQPNVESFLNPLLTAAMCLVLGARRELGVGRAIAVGALLAAASLYKPNAVLVGATMAIAWIAASRGARLAAVRDLGVVVLVGAGPWLGLVTALVRHHALDAFRDAVVTYNRAYGELPLFNFARGLQPKWLQPIASARLLPLWLAIAIGVTRLRSSWSRASWLVLAWIVGIHLTVSAPGKFWPHYYQLWLPLLATLAGVALCRVFDTTPRFAAAAAATALALAAAQIPSYRLTPEEWSQRKYGDVFVDARDAAVTINVTLRPGETFYEWGAETGLYFYTQRSPPSGVFYNLPMVSGPLAQELTDRVLLDLEKARPELFILYHDPARDPGEDAVVAWARDRYYPIGDAAPGYAMLARVRGRIQREMEAPR